MKSFSLLLLAVPTLSLAEPTIDPAENYAYSANTGWIDFLPPALSVEADSPGITFGEAFLSGYAYSGNLGWIHFGDGSPTNQQAYTNTSATDYGVNHDGAGNLSGYAYSANTGWINFGWATTSNSNRPKVDLVTGRFTGYAYGANTGWLNLGQGFSLSTESMEIVDTDTDGIADSWEQTHFGNLTTASATSDHDKDGSKDLDEFRANTDPDDNSEAFQLTLVNVDDGDLDYNIFVGANRLVTLHMSNDLSIINNVSSYNKTHNPLTNKGTISNSITAGSETKNFIRAYANLPLQQLEE